MRRLWCIVAAAVLLGGCEQGGPELPVHGIVTLDGKPLEGAAVTFYPTEKVGGTTGTARTDSEGKFVILGAKRQRGLVAGTYKVTVSKLAGEVTSEPYENAPSEEELRADLPAIWSDPSKTKLSYSVTGDGGPIEIKLDSKKK